MSPQIGRPSDGRFVFVAGCEENQVVFHPRFDHVVLLTAPLDEVVARVLQAVGE